MGELAKMFHGFEYKIENMNNEMKEALGLGKGTLRS